MTEHDDPPSAKNLENVETVVTLSGKVIEASRQVLIVDPGYCGLGIETGKHDPWWKRVCQPHDAHFNALKAGKPDTSNVKAQAEFASGILKGMAEGAWMLISGPFYLVFGGLIGGTLRYTQLQRRQAAKEGKPWPSNTPED